MNPFVVVLTCMIASGLHATAQAANPISNENQLPGTTEWKISPATQATGHVLEGYASHTSVAHGETIKFFISASPTVPYSLTVYRIGWYGGAGGRQVLAPQLLTASPQMIPAPDSFGMVECQWPESFSQTIPADWVSGVYLAKLSTRPPAALKHRYIIFVVRDDVRPSPYLFQTSVTTYQAYNPWGGRSLYTDGATRARKVSFNRPYEGNGAGQFLSFEIQTLRWLEREGYDVTYASNIDTHQKPDLLLSHKAFLSVGHDEYWSWPMRSNLERALQRGVGLGFLTANAAYWQVRLEPGWNGQADRTMVGYKECALVGDLKCTTAEGAADPSQRDPYAVDADAVNDRLVTTRWREFIVGRPEERLLGVQYELYDRQGMPVEEIGAIRMAKCDPVFCPSGVCDPVLCPAGAHWLLADTGLRAGDELPGLAGYEVDALHHHAPAGTQSIARSVFPGGDLMGTYPVAHDMTAYSSESGAVVFATGSIYWSYGLDAYGQLPLPGYMNAAAQQITRNFLSRVLLTSVPLDSVRLGGTISARSQSQQVNPDGSPKHPASNAGDGNLATTWLAQANAAPRNNNSWVQIDFGSRKHVDRVRWESIAAGQTPYPGGAPSSYSVLVSDDGVHWGSVITRNEGVAIVSGNEPVGRKARYVRLVTTQVADNTGYALCMKEFWAEGRPADPSSRLVPATLSASSSDPTYPVSYAADHHPNTVFLAGSPGNAAWLQLDLGRRVHLNSLRWDCHPTPGLSALGGDCPTNYQIWVSDASPQGPWVNAVTRTNSGPVAYGFEPLNHQGRYVRLETTLVGNGVGRKLSFWEIWVEGGGLLTGTVTTSGSGSFPASGAVDRNATTFWVANGPDAPPPDGRWIQLDFGRRMLVSRVGWQAVNGGPGEPTSVAGPADYRSRPPRIRQCARPVGAGQPWSLEPIPCTSSMEKSRWVSLRAAFA